MQFQLPQELSNLLQIEDGDDAELEAIAQKLETAKTELYRRSLEGSYYEFFRAAWKILEPETPLIDNWHIEYLCDILQGEVERLCVARRWKNYDYIINIPPRTAKSKLVNVMFCPWAWTRFPHLKVLSNSYADDIATELCVQSRRLIASEWYQKLWGHKYQLTTDQNTKQHYDNDHGGSRMSSSTVGGVTGFGYDIIINDDPQDPRRADSEVSREACKKFWGETLYSRLNNQRMGVRFVIQQRLHEEDLTGHLMENDPEKYMHICIPAELTDDVRPLELQKHYIEGLFFPAHPSFCPESLAEAQLPSNLGIVGYSSQYLQRPSPAGGDVFKRWWWNYWKPKGMDLPAIKVRDEEGKMIEKFAVDLPEKFDEVITSWDMAFKESEGSDYVSGDVWAAAGADQFLLNNIYEKMEFTKTISAVRLTTRTYPQATLHLVEDKANGPAVVSSLKHEIPGMIEWPAEQNKVARALPMSHKARSGNIYLPHPQLAQWVLARIERYSAFPHGKHDDDIDSGAHATNYFSSERKRVISAFNRNNAKHYRDYEINWLRIVRRRDGGQVYASLWQMQNMQVFLTLSLWDAIDGHLWVFAELMSEQTRIEMIIPRLQLILAPMRDKRENIRLDPKTFMWYGNKEMFGMQDNTMVMNAKRDGTANAYLEAGIPLQPNMFFDLQGSIQKMGTLFHCQRITIHTRCPDLGEQLHRWKIKKDRPDKEGCGFCLSLCNIVALLHSQDKFKPFLPKLKEYGDEKMKARAAIEKASKEDRLDEFVKKQKSQFVKPKEPLKIFRIR